ncbi:hypothetical protein [Ferruginibacter albus]|uniref:hypothetical protein n=1 Tax=Ferruginibacter albus TaxID=2875540 RepID=UPI001CC7DE7A|nr:hypothetical protein [Ferruginibacter albus]UAY53241.1 hypothetical protein K9M53_06110 [Ferruginibacter albus]
MKKMAILIFFLMFIHKSFCQVYLWRTTIGTSANAIDTFVPIGDSFIIRKKNLPDLFIDTIKINNYDYQITHYHIASKEIERKLINDTADQIFNDSLNQSSRLIFESNKSSFNIPTIPLTHIIYLQNLGIIVGLSKIAASPYNIVVYSTSGKLLCKRSLHSLELKLKKKNFKNLFKKKLGFSYCLNSNFIVKEKGNYFVETSKCLLNSISMDSLWKMKIIIPNHYFPSMNTSACLYCTYTNFFSDSDPFYDLILVNSKPRAIILNSDDGKKVRISLKSIN